MAKKVHMSALKQNETVLLTGAAGFIGGRIVERAVLEGLFHVRAGIHRWSSVARIARFPVEMVKLDILDRGSLIQAMKGSDYVIHCAYGNKRVTEEGTENVLQVALQVGVRRVVHLSTVEVYGNVSGYVDESSPLRYSGNAYADSKINAEKLCREYHKKGLSVVILRPAIVYGPFSKLWTVRISQLLLAGWGSVNNLDGICNHVYVDDLVNAILLSLSKESIDGECFNITSSDPVTWGEFFARFSSVLEIPSGKPKSLLYAYSRAYMIEPLRWLGKQAMSTHPELVLRTTSRWPLLKRIARYIEKQIKTTPSPKELKLYKRKAVYSIDKARSLLGYSPKFDLEKGLKLTAAWLKHHGFIS